MMGSSSQGKDVKMGCSIKRLMELHLSVPTEAAVVMPKVEFISYDGKWPALCHGTLRFTVDGKLFEWHHCLNSGGYTSWRGDEDLIVKGPWRVSREHHGLLDEDDPSPQEAALLQILTVLVNQHVPLGCCGGCL